MPGTNGWKILSRSALAAALATLYGLTVTAQPAAAAGTSAVLRYVALGDSYSSGTGSSSYLIEYPLACRRSVATYSHRIAGSALGGVPIGTPKLKACHSATTDHLYWPQYLFEAPQLDQVTPDTQLVTITIGGNDLGFVPTIVECVLFTCYGPLITPEQLQQTHDRLVQAYRDVRSRMAANGLLVVLSYPSFLPDPDDPADPLPTLQRCPLEYLSLDIAELRAIHQATTQVGGMIEDAVADTGDSRVVFVDILAAFRGHRVCADQPWSHGTELNVPESFHPNDLGYQAIADRLTTDLGLRR